MKDLIDSLKIRLSNPLIISFVISWLFWNWEIMIGLIWYNADTLKEYIEAENYFSFVKENSSWRKSFCWPFLSALTYTFLFPLIKWAITAFNTWVTTKEETHALKISKTGYVPTTRFIEAVQKSNAEIAKLSSLINEESRYIEENNKLKRENSELTKKNANLNKEFVSRDLYVSDLLQKSSVSFMEGKWNFRLFARDGEVFEYKVDISSDGWGRLRNISEKPQFNIKNFVCNPLTYSLSMVIAIEDQTLMRKETNFNRLIITKGEYIDGFLRGKSVTGSGYEIEMQRVESKSLAI